jgi:dihydrofolate synthase / folylpolyglutamate synthase
VSGTDVTADLAGDALRLKTLLDRLLAEMPLGWDLGLERMRALMAGLGDPQKRLPPTIHIAGTNGKGSTTAFCRAILEAHGKSVHVHTSPHLVRFNERYRLGRVGGGVLVDDARLHDTLVRVEAVAKPIHATFFEVITAAAFVLFSEHPADYCVIEVGLGGRLDATNVIEDPLVCAITAISFDHEKFLGDTLPKIAGEKAGIIKRGRPVVAAPQVDDVAEVFETVAVKNATRLRLGGQDWMVREENGRLVYEDEDGLLDLPPPKLLGRHQFINAGTAIAALRAAGLALDPEATARGVMAVEWPARMQRLAPGPLVNRAPTGAEVWLDGGHNPGAGKVIAHVMGDLEERVSRPLFLVVGMLQTKDPVGFFQSFAGLVRHVFTVPIKDHAVARTPQDLAEIAGAAGLSAQPVTSVAEALDFLHPWTLEPAPRILICGSLYLSGEVLAENDQLPK